MATVHAAASAEPAPAVLPDDAVEVGRVVGAWGVKGGLKIKPYAADPQALFSSKRWFLQPPLPVQGASQRAAAKAPAPAWPRLLHITTAREQGDHVVAGAMDLDDRDAAQALAGARIFVSRASFPSTGDDEFYWVDLIGLAVRNREGATLGTVAGLIETGPTCVLRVQPVAGAEDGMAPPPECLIPFVAAYVDRVDLAGRVGHVDWQPEDWTDR